MPEENIKLGLMPPLSGLVGIYGSEIAHAGQIACQEVNDNGGVLGRPLELIIEDDGSLPESAVTAAEKLLDEHQCTAIIGNLLSNSRIAVAYRVAEPRRVPYLNFSFYEGSILSRYFFHFAALPNQQIDKMIPYMLNKFGPRMFFAGNNYEWPRGSIHAGKLALKQAGGDVVGEEYCPIGVDPETIEHLLDQIEAAKPDVFVPYFAGDDQVLLLTRFTERGLKDRIAVVMGHYDEMMASQLPSEVRDGFYSSNTYFMTIDSDQNRNYLSRLANLPDVNGIWPEGNGILTNFGEGTYVCVKAFAEAANKAGSLDPELLVETLRSIRVEAPQGTVTMYPEHQHARVNTYLSKCDATGVFNIIEKFGAIEPALPERYNHQRIASQATLEDDIRLQARMLEQLSEGILLVGTGDNVIIYANAGANSMFGYDKGEMNGLNISSLIDPTVQDPNESSRKILSVLNQKGEWEGELQSLRKNGTTLLCAAKVTIFTHPVYGEVWLGVYRDITEKKITEDELEKYRHHLEELVEERTRKLNDAQDELVRKERLATLGQLTATVSHELRNPLGAIRPSIYVIRNKVPQGDAKLKRALDRIDRNIERCDHIIDELLDFTRIKELNLTHIDLNSWLRKLINEQHINNNIKIIYELSDKTPRIDVDEDRLRRAIINVVENACQAMLEPYERDTVIKNAQLGISTQIDGERILITISDNGCGISEDTMPHIFEPLFSTKGFGVGLGMPTVKQIITQHGGTINIDTAADKGTHISLSLPKEINSEAAL